MEYAILLHFVDSCLPSEIILFFVSVEDNVFRIAVSGKHIAYVLLLVGREPARAVFVTVVHAVVAKIGRKACAHLGIVLAENLVVDVFEAVGVYQHLFLFEIFTLLVPACRWQHGSSHIDVIWDVLTHGIAYALFFLRTFGIEAKQVARTNLFKIKLVFHVFKN